MSDSKYGGLEYIEADLLFEPLSVANVQPISTLDPHPDEMTITRDQNFKIKLEMTGTAHPGAGMRNANQPPLGTVSDAKDTEGTSGHGTTKVYLKGLIAGSLNHNHGTGKFRMFGSLSRVIEEYRPGVETKSSILYLLGFPSGTPVRGSTRKASGEIVLERNAPEMGDATTIKRKLNASAPQHSHSRDSILIKANHGTALLCKGAQNERSERFQPSYLHFASGAGVLDQEAKRSFLEAVNFCFGKRLIEVGHTDLDADHKFIRRSSRSPYTLNIHAEARAVDLPPANIYEEYDFIDEAVVAKIVDLFLDARTKLNLSDVMWNLWTARMMPLGLELVAYAAALEALITAWFEHNTKPERSLYVPKDEFVGFMTEYFQDIKTKARKTDGWAKIQKNLGNTNRLSLTDKYKRFFEELGLKLDAVEEEVLISRHKYAHGGVVDGADAKRLVVIARAYEALLNRCILKAIGFDGVYRDYSTLNFPFRSLTEPMGGPNNNGVI